MTTLTLSAFQVFGLGFGFGLCSGVVLLLLAAAIYSLKRPKP